LRILRLVRALAVALGVTGCAAIHPPRPALLPQTAEALPLRIGICPGAEAAERWLTAQPVFTRVGRLPLADGTERPDLVVTEATSEFRAGIFAKPVPASTRVTEVFSIISLGVLPTYINQQGTAQVVFRRPISAEAPCDPAPSGAPTLLVRATPSVKSFLAFWVFVPALIAALPHWYLAGGDEIDFPKIEPGEWIAAEAFGQRDALVRLARP